MKDFLKENFVLVLGVSLPVILIVVFMIAQSMTKLVDPPQYKAVFALQNHYHGQKPFKFKVDETGKLTITYTEPEIPENQSRYNYNTRLYIYDPVTDNLQETELDAPDGLKENESTVISIAATENLIINTATKSPDGYIFTRHNRRGGNLFTELFGYRHSNVRYVLKKDTRVIPITPTRYYYGNDHFIGWVTKEGKTQ